jgi:hypothetical protein
MAGMVSFTDFVQFPLNLFKVIGLLPDEVSSDSKKERLRKIYHFLMMANLLLNSLRIIVYIKDHASDIVSMTENGNAPLAIFKVLTFCRALPEFRDLMETLQQLFPKSQSDQELFNVRKYLQSYKKVERVAHLMMAFFLVVLLLLPIINFVLFNDQTLN